MSRWIVLLLAVSLLLGVAPTAGAAVTRQAGAAVSLDSLEGAVLARINAVRAARGLTPLRAATGLDRAASGHAQSMATNGFFSHTSRSGTSAAARIREHYNGSTVGETMLWRSPGVSAQQVVQMWLDSGPHRAIMLGGGFREIGLGAVHVDGAPGVFGGLDVTIVVADFGARS